jgi:hypothetical protein
VSDLAIGTAVGLAVGLVVGIPLALLGQRYLFALLRERKALGYEILAAGVIIPEVTQLNPAASVVVRRSALEGRERDPAQPDDLVAVDEVYGFRVRVRNCGNAILDNQAVRLSFDERSKVILANMESGPELGDERVDIAVTEGGKSVVARFPYLNPKDTAVISVQTVYNSSRSCEVVAAGRGLHSFDMATRRNVTITVVTGLLVLALVVPGGILMGLGETDAVSRNSGEAMQTVGLALLFVGTMFLSLLIAGAIEGVTRRRSRRGSS